MLSTYIHLLYTKVCPSHHCDQSPKSIIIHSHKSLLSSFLPFIISLTVTVVTLFCDWDSTADGRAFNFCFRASQQRSAAHCSVAKRDNIYIYIWHRADAPANSRQCILARVPRTARPRIFQILCGSSHAMYIIYYPSTLTTTLSDVLPSASFRRTVPRHRHS